MESAQQVGRMSVCNAPNMSFLEMTNHFEQLGVGKQTKMSNVMGMQQRPVNEVQSVPSLKFQFCAKLDMHT